MCGEDGKGRREGKKKRKEWDEKGQLCDERKNIVGKKERTEERWQQLNGLYNTKTMTVYWTVRASA